MSHFKLLSAILFGVLLGSAPLTANPFLITEESDYIYGQGVHAFFDNNYEKAITILSRAEAINTEDPRPYYFLGLAYLRQQQTEKADEYFTKAAELEYSGRALRDYAVSESLRRIQGEERLRLQNIRNDERAKARIREQRIREARYGIDTAAAREALRDSLPQVSYEDAAALREVNELGGNAFAVNPMNPIGPAEENIVVRRADTADTFGGIAANVGVPPDASEAAQPSLADLLSAVDVPERRNPADMVAGTGTGRAATATGRMEPAVEEPLGFPGMMAPMGVSSLVISPSSTLIQSGAPKQLGRALGTLFSSQ